MWVWVTAWLQHGQHWAVETSLLCCGVSVGISNYLDKLQWLAMTGHNYCHYPTISLLPTLTAHHLHNNKQQLQTLWLDILRYYTEMLTLQCPDHDWGAGDESRVWSVMRAGVGGVSVPGHTGVWSWSAQCLSSSWHQFQFFTMESRAIMQSVAPGVQHQTWADGIFIKPTINGCKPAFNIPYYIRRWGCCIWSIINHWLDKIFGL